MSELVGVIQAVGVPATAFLMFIAFMYLQTRSDNASRALIEKFALTSSQRAEQLADDMRQMRETFYQTELAHVALKQAHEMQAAQLAVAQELLSDKQRQIEDMGATITRQQQAIDALTRKVDGLAESLEAEKRITDELRKEVYQMRMSLEEAQEQREAAENRVAQLLQENQQLKTENGVLYARVDALRQQVDALNTLNDELVARLNEIENRLTQEQQEDVPDETTV